MRGLKCTSSSFLGVFHLSRLMNLRDIYANPHAVASRRQGFGKLPRLNLTRLAPSTALRGGRTPAQSCRVSRIESLSLGPGDADLSDLPLWAAPCCSQKVPHHHQFTARGWCSVVSNLFSSGLVKNSAGITFSCCLKPSLVQDSFYFPRFILLFYFSYINFPILDIYASYLVLLFCFVGASFVMKNDLITSCHLAQFWFCLHGIVRFW